MKQKFYLTCIAVLMLSLITGCANQQQKLFKEVSLKKHSAVTPVQRKSDWWVKRFNLLNERIKQNPDTKLLFVGDSITHSWDSRKGQKVWQQYYTKRKAVNIGISADRTQHVLWRLDYGNVDGISPKAAVLMIGTNNSNRQDNTAEEIADGIIAICKKLQEKLPKTKILMLAIFPRGPKPSMQREKNAKASLLASRIADNKTIFYLDIGDKFLTKDKILTKEIMPDYLHPNEKGYCIWAQAIEPKLKELLGEK